MIFLSSVVACAGVAVRANYAASTAYDLLLAKGLARELRRDGISVLALCPGATRTAFWPRGARQVFPLEPNSVLDIALRKLGQKKTVSAGWFNFL
jgi:short-subunit dehydrogenase